MFKIFYLPDMTRFLNLVQKSRGCVLLHLPDGTLCDLKRDHTALQLLRMTQPQREGLHFSLSDPHDLPPFLSYMMEANL